MKEFKGTGVALITPFTEERKVDADALKRVVEYQIENGIDYLVALGTTAESVTLSADEKQIVIDAVIDANKGRLPLVLGIGGNNTAALVSELTTRDLSHFTAVLSVSPMYNRPTQEGIYQHFAALAKASPKPIIMYNVPPRTGSNMLPETVIRLANDFDSIIGLKEAAGDLVQAMRMIDGTPDEFLVTSGDDMLALPMTLAGGAGVISVIGQGLPKEFSEMIRLGLNRKVEEAYKLHYKIAPGIDYIFEEGNPAGIKTMLDQLGLCRKEVRLPLVQVSSDLRSRIETFTASF